LGGSIHLFEGSIHLLGGSIHLFESPIHHFGGSIHLFHGISTIGGGRYPSLLTSRYKKGEINGFIYRK